MGGEAILKNTGCLVWWVPHVYQYDFHPDVSLVSGSLLEDPGLEASFSPVVLIEITPLSSQVYQVGFLGVELGVIVESLPRRSRHSFIFQNNWLTKWCSVFGGFWIPHRSQRLQGSGLSRPGVSFNFMFGKLYRWLWCLSKCGDH